MKQRFGIAQALLGNPKIIIVDEPTAGLDPINGKLIDDLILQLRDQKKVTSIVVTHEMDSAFAVATRMAFLHEGKIILEGTPEEFRRSDHPIVSKFLSAYSANKSDRK